MTKAKEFCHRATEAALEYHLISAVLGAGPAARAHVFTVRELDLLAALSQSAKIDRLAFEASIVIELAQGLQDIVFVVFGTRQIDVRFHKLCGDAIGKILTQLSHVTKNAVRNSITHSFVAKRATILVHRDRVGSVGHSLLQTDLVEDMAAVVEAHQRIST